MMSRTVGWCTLFLIGTDLFVISPLLPEITHELGMSTSSGGAAVAVFAAAYCLGGPSLGALADRRGRYAVLGATLVVFAAANLASALAPTPAILLVARAAAGLAASGITPSVYALIGATAPTNRRAEWLAVVTSGLLLALAIGAPAGSLLGAAVTWRGVFGLLAVAAVVMLAITTRTRRHALHHFEPTSESTTRPESQNQDSSPSPTCTPPSMVLRLRAVVVTGLWATATYGLYTYLGTILRDTVRLDAGAVALALVCFGLGALLGNLAGGRLADRHGGRAVSITTLIVLAIAEAAVGLTIRAPTVLLLAMLGITALAAYPFFSAQQARLITAYPHTSGALLAWNNSAMYAGILLGSTAGGPVLTRLGAPVLAFATAAMALVAAIVATSSIPASSAPAAITRRQHVRPVVDNNNHQARAGYAEDQRNLSYQVAQRAGCISQRKPHRASAHKGGSGSSQTWPEGVRSPTCWPTG